MSDRLPCPLCEKTSASIGALRHHVKHQHGLTLGQVTGVTRRPQPTHCPSGHEFTEENTYRSTGRPNIRHCRQCRSLYGHHRHPRLRLPKLDETGERVRNSKGHLMYISVAVHPDGRRRKVES